MSDQSRHENGPEQPGDDPEEQVRASAGPDAAPVEPDADAAEDATEADAADVPVAADAAVVPPAPPTTPIDPSAPVGPSVASVPPAFDAGPASVPPPFDASPASVPPPPPVAPASVPAAAPGSASVPPAVPPAAPTAAPTSASVPPAPSVGPDFPAPAAPQTPAAVAPGARIEAGSWFSPFSAKVLLGGLAHVGVAVAAAFLGGLILFALLLSLGSSAAASTPVRTISDMLDGVGILAGLLFTLTAVVFGGELNVDLGGGSGFLSGGGSVSLWMFPLTLTVAALVAVLWWGVRQGQRNPLPTRTHRIAYGVAVGLVTGLVLLLLALIFTVRVDATGMGLTLSAAGFRVVLFSTLLVGLVAWAGREAGALAPRREPWGASAVRLLRAAPRVVREWLAYTAFGAVAFGVVGAVFSIFSTWDGIGFGAIGVALIGMLNIAPLAAALGHLGGITAAGGLTGGLSSSSTVTVFNAGEASLWIAVLVAVLLTLFVALWIGTRRPRVAGIRWGAAWQLPVVVFAAWLILGSMFFGARLAANGSIGMFGGALNGGIEVALWSAFVFLLWAVVVEFAAQTLPRIAYGLAPAALGVIVGRRALAAWVAGTPAPTAQQTYGADATVPPAPGAAPGAAAHGAAAAPLAEPAPLSPAAKRGLIIGGSAVGAIVLLAIAGTITVGVLNANRSAEAVAQQYLDHLAAGEAEAANALVDPNVPNAERQYLTDDVLASATERISAISVRSAENIGERAMIPVSYKLDGVTREAYLEAHKGDPQWLVLDTWELTSSLATPTSFYASGPGSVSIGGIPLEVDSGEASAVLYPGIYELATDDSTYLALEDSTLIVEAGRGSMKNLQFVPTDALADEVAAQVDALLKECVAQTAADPEGCPFRAYTYNDDTEVTWKLQGDPTIEIGQDARRVQVSGVVVGSYSEEFFGTTRERDDEKRYSMYGEVSVDADEVTVEFDNSWW